MPLLLPSLRRGLPLSSLRLPLSSIRLPLSPLRLLQRPLSCSPSLLLPKEAATLSSTGDSRHMVTKLVLPKMLNVAVYGSPNGQPLDTVVPGALEALEVVTRAAARAEWGQLEGLLEPQCIQGLQAALEGLDREQRGLLELNSGDVFLTFIANPNDLFRAMLSNEKSCENGNNLNIVTFSFPGLEAIGQTRTDIKDRLGQLAEAKTDEVRMADIVEATKEEQIRIQKLFSGSEIVIGNYRLVRSSASSSWAVREVRQTSLGAAYHPFFRARWRTMLNQHVRTGVPFMKLLRAYYISLWLVLAVIYLPAAMAVVLVALFLGMPV